MERWDLYDENRTPLGRTAFRGETLNEGEYHLVAVIWTADKDGKILLTKRSPEKPYFPNEWENSGGAVLAGETSPNAAHRELFEETGLRAGKNGMILLGSCKEDHYFVDTYLALLDEAAPKVTFQPGETVDARWVTLPELDRIVSENGIIAPAIRQLAPLRERLEKEIRNAGK